MSKFYKYLSITYPHIDKNQYYDKFDSLRIATNNSRCKRMVNILLILNVILIVVDLTIYKPMRVNTPSYVYLYYSHIIISLLIILWLILLNLQENKKYISLSPKFFYSSFLNLILYWGVFMGLNNVYISGQITGYIVCVLATSVYLYLEPVEALLTYSSSLTILIVSLIFTVNNSKLLYTHIINSSIVFILSYIISKINFLNFLKEFIHKKKILESKHELEKINLKLKEYEKLRTDFFANISHELKTPINVIFCAEQIIDFSLKQNQCNDDNLNKYLKMIKQNSYRLTRLIGNLIDITKIDDLNFEVKLINADIIQVVEDITMSVAAFVEDKGISLIFDTEVEEKVIAFDPNQIERVILNLLSNAIKFTDKAGEIFVSIYLEDNNVCLSVKDTGIGIPENMLNSIFDRFIQVDNALPKNHEGSGIGLSLVKSLVEMHNGSINVKSKLGEGSEFIVSLPDITIPNSEQALDSTNMENDYIKKINIEFSDIYQ